MSRPLTSMWRADGDVRAPWPYGVVMRRIVLVLAILAAGCAAPEEPRLAACDMNWRAVGEADGEGGAGPERLDVHARNCARAGGVLSYEDRADWRAGWAAATGEEMEQSHAEARRDPPPRVYPKGFVGVGSGGVSAGLGFGIDFGSFTLGLGWGF